MDEPGSLDRGRKAFAERDWNLAYESLSAADAGDSLGAGDTVLLSIVAHMTGRDAERDELASRAFKLYLDAGDIPNAVRCAYQLMTVLGEKGDYAQAGGWMMRARRLLDEWGEECVEQGYLIIPMALQALGSGDPATARDHFSQAGEIAERYGDIDLLTMSRLGRGRSLVELGETAEGMALQDEAMLAVSEGAVNPILSGIVYCAMIDTCRTIFDLRRAREWTSALNHWCDSQAGLVPFRGQCLISRVEIMRMQGSWPDAMEEAQRACALLETFPNPPVKAFAHYQQAEIQRLRGEFALAEESYRQAARLGESPQPGLALLRLAQGQLEAAESAVRLAVEEAGSPASRARLLSAFVEVCLACGKLDDAGAAASDLVALAAKFDSAFLVALGDHWSGAVLLAEGDAEGAMAKLRRAWGTFRELDAPYEAARTRLLIGRGRQSMGDTDTAEMELDAARWVFRELGAAIESSGLEPDVSDKPSGGLTARELEVLGLIAAGKTNRGIATDLFLSEKTVARHVSNIFTKLDVTTRSAATAFAFRNGII